ncbi:MlaD family protein [Nocardia huaxiensis]|uniref:MCE family protein n=1 Tax=Nocardia huaxiensis TaxID=2755382 RepID=A0A7D6V8R2_9NOCA|nr:MCE family protein [Nocardia huaxiensis]QLY29514.1 MCE family protein [Nocardia huaxiensis]UFS96928.1 MCE family protein [Nocardia huaxiensis]
MKSVRSAAIRLSVVAVVIMVMGAMIWTALQTPVKEQVRGYAAHITDVSGLKKGSDVRMAGVQVGKVTNIQLDGSVAYVEFSVAEGQEVYDNTEVSVLFASLIGDRYLALQQKVAPGNKIPAGTTIPITRTHGSFDISELFDAIRPIFETLSSGSVDKFLENLLLVVSGDGRGLGPVMDGLNQVIAVAAKQEPVVALLADNFSSLLTRFEGQSPKIDAMIDQLLDLVDALYGKLDTLKKLIDEAIPGMGAFQPLFDRLAGIYYDNFPGMERLYNSLLGEDMVTFIRQTLAAVPMAMQAVNSLTLEPKAGERWSCLSGLPIPTTILMGVERMGECR